MRAVPRNLSAALFAGGAARLAYRRLSLQPPGRGGQWDRTNFRGEPVTLLEGPALALGIAAAAALAPGMTPAVRIAGAGAAVGVAAVGAYDDLRGDGNAKGLGGHLKALTAGKVTTGAVKVLGIGAIGVAAGSVVRGAAGVGGATTDRLLAGVVVAGSANVLNLFDLRPGRAAKVALIAGLPGALRGGPAGVLAASALGATAALLPEDLAARTMLGDSGANAIGAVLGVAAAARASRGGLVAAAAALVALTMASEKVSFSKVIAASPPLNALDQLGRRP